MKSPTVRPRVIQFWQHDRSSQFKLKYISSQQVCISYDSSLPSLQSMNHVFHFLKCISNWGLHYPDCRISQLPLCSHNGTLMRLTRCKKTKLSLPSLCVWWIFVWLNYHWKLKDLASDMFMPVSPALVFRTQNPRKHIFFLPFNPVLNKIQFLPIFY